MALKKVGPGRGFTVARRTVKDADDNKSYNFVAVPVPIARRRKVVNGATLDVRQFAVDISNTTFADLQSATLSLASFYTGQQADLGNPPTRVLVDNSPVKSPAKVRRNIRVYFGIDARPAMEEVAAIIAGGTRNHVFGIIWSWKISKRGESGYSLVPPGPVPMNDGDRLILVPTGARKDLLSLYNIAYRIGIEPNSWKKVSAARKSGFLKTAGRRAKGAVSPLFYVRMRWSEKMKSGSGSPSGGRWNFIRASRKMKLAAPYIQGDPVFVMTLGLGGRRGNIGRRT